MTQSNIEESNQKNNSKLSALLKNKKKVFVLRVKANLTLKAKLVYSFRAFEDCYYNTTPSKKKVLQATGLAIATIQNADNELMKLGLIRSDRSVEVPEEYHARATKSDKWVDRISYWACYIRDPRAPITHLQSCLLSFLWHSILTGFRPASGWSISYLAKVLFAGRKAITEALDKLQALKAIKYMTTNKGIEIKIFEPREEMLRWFKDTKSRAITGKPLEMIEEDSDNIAKLNNDLAGLAIGVNGINKITKRRVDLIIQSPQWELNPAKEYEFIKSELASRNGTGKEWLLTSLRWGVQNDTSKRENDTTRGAE